MRQLSKKFVLPRHVPDLEQLRKSSNVNHLNSNVGTIVQCLGSVSFGEVSPSQLTSSINFKSAITFKDLFLLNNFMLWLSVDGSECYPPIIGSFLHRLCPQVCSSICTYSTCIQEIFYMLHLPLGPLLFQGTQDRLKSFGQILMRFPC